MAEREIPGGVVRGDCHQVIEEMERLSVAQQDRLISVCATDPNARRKEYGDIPANSRLIRDAIGRVLGDRGVAKYLGGRFSNCQDCCSR
ncbi:hypothetical protein [Achromobacter xylosoxidans]|uniref:hypothetical protein n=1 Tax=Alcaligenes xylosoxydans xylosoxydans TaxID=85698 RepID=UPI00131CD7EF|nr:hypothetical protein [Achromobacter xylosoxidans]